MEAKRDGEYHNRRVDGVGRKTPPINLSTFFVLWLDWWLPPLPFPAALWSMAIVVSEGDRPPSPSNTLSVELPKKLS